MPRPTSSRAEWSALAFAGLFPTFATWLYFVVLPASGWSQPAFAAAKLLQFAFPVVWIWGVERDPVRPGRFQMAGLGLGMLSGLALMALQTAVYTGLLAGTPLVQGARTVIGEKLAAFGISTPFGFLLLALFYSAVHSLLEEYYWRWFLFGRLRRRLPAAAAIAVSSLAFTAHHVLVIGEFVGGYGPLTWLFALTVTGAGAFWAWLYDRTGTLGGPWLSHALVDAGLMGVGYGLWRG
ncbi:MAG TPA: CPBP family intramembrane glutamic endopeptidase [Thermoanaerobaculia bacterium]|nr:CPBP family intramembrane glutamic endopeptidase [Thermoanaerobaculia bacterium]